MKYTTNKNLKLPDYTDVVDVQNFNDNFTTVDSHMGEAIVSDTGAHGFRYNRSSNTFEYYNSASSSWVSVSDSFLPPKKKLNDTSWEEISLISNLGIGANYWAVGDRKEVMIKGNVGLTPVNATYYVYILGFNHNSGVEGSGIHFGGFKTALSGGYDICLIDSSGSVHTTDGSKHFNINHSNVTNVGGWKASDIRYDVLGSTNVKGLDAGATTATSPVSDTLMAAFPTDLRRVMKPIKKYTDNVGGGSIGDGEASYITATIDYLPLLSEYEIFGKTNVTNSAEQNYQMQYDYYSSGNSKVKYSPSNTGGSYGAYWWGRSPVLCDNKGFFLVAVLGDQYSYDSDYIEGLSPVFMV